MNPPWLEAACSKLQVVPALVRITVARTRGSSPREPGATMLVTATTQWGTIGGGHLEWQAIEQARRLLAGMDEAPVRVEHLRLGPDLAQCCGGEVSLWMERIGADELDELRALRDSIGCGALRTRLEDGQVLREARPMEAPGCLLEVTGTTTQLDEAGPELQPLWIFGAGHVGSALMRLLQDLPLFRIHWIDSRSGIADADPALAPAVTYAPEPVELVAAAPAGTLWLVLTHDHELDFQLCSAILARGDAGWLGLIGSASKAARFRSRLRRTGHAGEAIASLESPVGLTTLRSKLPAAIAVGIAARLLERATREAERSAPASQAMPALPTLCAGDDTRAIAVCDAGCARCAERRPA